jgi:pyridoxamine 5'-phosphate oxidase
MNVIRNKIKQSKSLTGPFPSFDIEKASEYPYQLFLEWFDEAVNNGVHGPHTMTLSTIDCNGSPDSRVLILKDVDEYGWYFASSSQSSKGKQMDANPNVALNFYWSLLGKQVRIRGKVSKMDEEMSAKDFLKRGTVAKAISLIGKQSSILETPCDVDEALVNQLHRIRKNPTLVYPFWTLYKVMAEEVEFWQADEERKHTRLRYSLEGGKWYKKRLWA